MALSCFRQEGGPGFPEGSEKTRPPFQPKTAAVAGQHNLFRCAGATSELVTKEKRTMFTKDDLISSYTRRQAIADGVLIDVTETAKEAGFKMPVAVTAALWAECVTVPHGISEQDERGRLWDVLFSLSFSIRANRPVGSAHPFRVCVRNTPGDGPAELVELYAVCGPDDDGGPCLTVMKTDED